MTATAIPTTNRTRIRALLRDVVGDRHDAAINDLADSVRLVIVAAGEVLFEAGDIGDAAYVIVSGRLHILPPPTNGAHAPEPMIQCGPGELVGELALLRDTGRARTVVAARDTTLIWIDHPTWARWSRQHPAAVLDVTRQLLDRLLGAEVATRRTARILALVPVHERAATQNLGTALLRALPDERTMVLDAADVDAALGSPGIADCGHGTPDAVRLDAWVDELERDHDILVLETDETFTGWTERALALADEVIFVADAMRDPGTTDIERRCQAALPTGPARPHTTLLLEHPPTADLPVGTRDWLSVRPVNQHLHVRHDHAGDLGRMTRTLAGRPVTLVLGGGGAKGFAHLGVIRAMHEIGIPIDAVIGSSIGATMTINVAQDWPVETLVDRYTQLFDKLLDYTLPTVSLVRGRSITRSIEAACAGRDIEDTWIPSWVMSTNLTQSREVLHDRGSMAHAVRASVAIPGVLPPVALDGDVLIDAGCMNNLPVDWMRRLRPTGRIIAVDVAPSSGPRARSDFAPDQSGWQRLRRRLTPGATNEDVPGLLSTMVAATVVASARDRRAHIDGGSVDVFLDLDLRGFGLLAFDRVQEGAERGYADAFDALATWWAGQADGAVDARDARDARDAVIHG